MPGGSVITMAPKHTQSSLLLDFHLRLKSQLREWINTTGTKHSVLASMLGLDISAISHAIRPQGRKRSL